MFYFSPLKWEIGNYKFNSKLLEAQKIFTVMDLSFGMREIECKEVQSSVQKITFLD